MSLKMLATIKKNFSKFKIESHEANIVELTRRKQRHINIENELKEKRKTLTKKSPEYRELAKRIIYHQDYRYYLNREIIKEQNFLEHEKKFPTIIE